MEQNNDPLQQTLNESFSAIEEERENNLHLRVENKLAGLAARATDKRQSFTGIIAANPQGCAKQLRNSITIEMEGIIGGDLQVFAFVQHRKAQQEYYLFNGTHWEIINPQRFFDFIMKCCTTMGLDDRFRLDSGFMLKLYEDIALHISHAPQSPVHVREAWINLTNGTLELHADGSRTFREHCREDYFNYTLDYAYDENATCERFMTFLDQVLPEKEAQEILREFIGYSFTEGLKLEKMLMLYGQGSNGKSVTMDVIERLLGRNNVSNVSLNELTTDDEKRSLIEGKRMNISYESDKDLDISVLKRLVSGEPTIVRQLYIGSHVMYNYGKLVTSFNVLPRAEQTSAFFRRTILMPFKVTISEQDADKQLPEKLAKELPGILNWVLAGLEHLLHDLHFTESQMCNDALAKYRLSSDSVRLFAKEQLEMDYPYNTQGSEIFKAYKNYCHESELKPVGKQKFYERLEAIGAVRTESNRNVMFNVIMKSENEQAF